MVKIDYQEIDKETETKQLKLICEEKGLNYKNIRVGLSRYRKNRKKENVTNDTNVTNVTNDTNVTNNTNVTNDTNVTNVTKVTKKKSQQVKNLIPTFKEFEDIVKANPEHPFYKYFTVNARVNHNLIMKVLDFLRDIDREILN